MQMLNVIVQLKCLLLYFMFYYIFAMFVLDRIDGHMVEVRSSIGSVTALYIERDVSLCLAHTVS